MFYFENTTVKVNGCVEVAQNKAQEWILDAKCEY
jgi:hypothetical protein